MNDESLKENFSVAAWPLENLWQNRMFQHFRIKMMGTNSEGSWTMCCSGIELYGTGNLDVEEVL